MGLSLPLTNWKCRWGPAWSGCFLCEQAPSNCAPIAIWRPSCCVRCQMLLLGVAVSWRSRCGNRMLVKNRKLLEFTTHEIQINSYCWPTCSPWCLPSTRGSAAPGGWSWASCGVLWGSKDTGCLVPGKGFGVCLQLDSYLQLLLLQASTPEGFPKAAELQLGYPTSGFLLKGGAAPNKQERKLNMLSRVY